MSENLEASEEVKVHPALDPKKVHMIDIFMGEPDPRDRYEHFN